MIADKALQMFLQQHLTMLTIGPMSNVEKSLSTIKKRGHIYKLTIGAKNEEAAILRLQKKFSVQLYFRIDNFSE